MLTTTQPSSIAGRVRSLANPNKPIIDFHFGGDAAQSQPYAHAFSTGDKIEGHVSVVSPHDTKFDDFEIYLLGGCS